MFRAMKFADEFLIVRLVWVSPRFKAFSLKSLIAMQYSVIRSIIAEYKKHLEEFGNLTGSNLLCNDIITAQ